jgi:hypothetical protein
VDVDRNIINNKVRICLELKGNVVRQVLVGLKNKIKVALA